MTWKQYLPPFPCLSTLPVSFARKGPATPGDTAGTSAIATSLMEDADEETLQAILGEGES